jgi:hypothetical protein
LPSLPGAASSCHLLLGHLPGASHRAKRARALIQDWADVVGFLATDFAIKSEDLGFSKKRVRADGGSQRYLHFEKHPAYVAKSRYGLPAKMPVPLDLDFDKKLAPFFPPAAAGEAVPYRRPQIRWLEGA